jgi:hypothetical protein
MEQHRRKAPPITPLERRWAAVEGALGAGLLGLGVVLLALGGLGLGTALLGRRTHPDAALLPLLGGVLPLGLGALLRLAAGAMRRGAPNRWVVQGMALAVPAVLAFLVWLSLP